MATQADKVNTGALTTIVVVLAVSTLGISAALTALVRYETSELGAQKGVTANLRTYRELVSVQRAELNREPAWVDKAKDRVSIPVERAMELVVQDLRKDPNLATESADGGAPTTADGGAPTANEMGEKSFDQEHAGVAKGAGGVTPEEAVKQGGPDSKRDTDTKKAPKKKPPPAPKPAPGKPQGGTPAPTSGPLPSKPVNPQH
jgi:hypothetical protein